MNAKSSCGSKFDQIIRRCLSQVNVSLICYNLYKSTWFIKAAGSQRKRNNVPDIQNSHLPSKSFQEIRAHHTINHYSRELLSKLWFYCVDMISRAEFEQHSVSIIIHPLFHPSSCFLYVSTLWWLTDEQTRAVYSIRHWWIILFFV